MKNPRESVREEETETLKSEDKPSGRYELWDKRRANEGSSTF